MKILISNDDGIAANGIRALAEALSVENDVYMIAPDSERSAAGHSLTMHTPLRVEELEPKFGLKRTWVTSGTPGDCIKIGLSVILSPEEKPDLIISGINHGPNLGVDILYSGTVSCALEGAMRGYPSIAVSLASMKSDYEDFKPAAEFVADFAPALNSIDFPKKSILNINIPKLAKEDISGIAFTKLGDRMFTDNYDKRVDPRGKVYYWLAGELVPRCSDDSTDINAVRNNKISITPVTFEMTHKSIMADLEKAFCKDGVCKWGQM